MEKTENKYSSLKIAVKSISELGSRSYLFQPIKFYKFTKFYAGITKCTTGPKFSAKSPDYTWALICLSIGVTDSSDLRAWCSDFDSSEEELVIRVRGDTSLNFIFFGALSTQSIQLVDDTLEMILLALRHMASHHSNR